MISNFTLDKIRDFYIDHLGYKDWQIDNTIIHYLLKHLTKEQLIQLEVYLK